MEKLTNRIKVLDEGFISLMSASLTGDELLGYHRAYCKTTEIQDTTLSLPQVHIELKCPIFVQLNLSKFGFNMTVMPSNKMEAFIPTIDQIKAKDHETSLDILENIRKSTEALLMNPKSLAYSGCDTFISQIICPISMYNTIMVSGSLKNWMMFTNQAFLPSTIDSYRKAVVDILVSEWHYLEDRIGEGK